MTIQKFENLQIFKDASDICNEIYRITRQGDFQYDTRFVQQIRAAAGSIMDNIAEGYERDGNKELMNFLYIAKGSCGEVRSQLIRAHSVGFIDDLTYQNLYDKCLKESIRIANFIKSIKKTDYKGNKYYQPKSKIEEPPTDI